MLCVCWVFSRGAWKNVVVLWLLTARIEFLCTNIMIRLHTDKIKVYSSQPYCETTQLKKFNGSILKCKLRRSSTASQ